MAALSVAQGVAAVRAVLERDGLLLSHDARLPSLTTLVAGEPVVGSWWGHPAGHTIFAVQSALHDEVLWPKLVDGKVTLVHARLWAALAAIGAAGEPWQLRALPPALVELLARLEREGEVSGALAGGAGGITLLERRLLCSCEQQHTEAGHHRRVLRAWSRVAPEVVRPSVEAAKVQFERVVAGWGGGRLPW